MSDLADEILRFEGLMVSYHPANVPGSFAGTPLAEIRIGLVMDGILYRLPIDSRGILMVPLSALENEAAVFLVRELPEHVKKGSVQKFSRVASGHIREFSDAIRVLIRRSDGNAAHLMTLKLVARFSLRPRS